MVWVPYVSFGYFLSSGTRLIFETVTISWETLRENNDSFSPPGSSLISKIRFGGDSELLREGDPAGQMKRLHAGVECVPVFLTSTLNLFADLSV